MKNEFNKEVEMFYGSSFKIFDDLLSQFKIENIYSYQESGIKSTWKRDLKIKSQVERFVSFHYLHILIL